MQQQPSPTPAATAAAELDDDRLERAVGRQVRLYRTQLNRTVSDVARAAGLSPGMLSKIENGATSPSLTTVGALARALNLSVSALFAGIDDRCTAVHIPAERVLTDGRHGADTRLLAHVAGRGVAMEPVVVTIPNHGAAADIPADTGTAFVQVLAGELVYRHGEQSFRLRETDCLALDAEVDHAPEAVVRAPVRLLLVQAKART
ncbi:helix-turn-helix domain-containing protein [Limimonas halophila]|nr:XRE family transcriptional regulator [Limimonas halophila]